ncbi:hypothetical protein ECP03052936_1004 [Escherichia coli p0305293.6]|nr:hypothetical protein [Escherichia coli]ENH57893.1 hypothetical protein ECP03052936_1004 [Escherichia coli p0305293.6]
MKLIFQHGDGRLLPAGDLFALSSEARRLAFCSQKQPPPPG